jgi:hypothetical protein
MDASDQRQGVGECREAVQLDGGDFREQASGNPFFERWALDAAVGHLASSAQEVQVVPVGDCGNALPLMRRWRTPPGIGPVWTVWDHIHCFDTTPAGDGATEAVAEAVFDFLAGKGASILRWSSLPADTPFYEKLIGYLERAGLSFEITKTQFRPVLSADGGGGKDCASRLGEKRMNEFRRRRRKLEKKGKLELQIHRGVHDAAIWMNDFIDLEASGWKGRQGTAIACRPAERAFFERLMRDAAARGKALVCSLALDGRPIAMTTSLRTGDRVWGFKTAYSDELARFSPGSLIFLETTEYVLREPSIAWMDSCMENDGGLLGQLWEGRREVVDLLISARPSNNWMPKTAKLALEAVRATRSTMRFSRHRERNAPAIRLS